MELPNSKYYTSYKNKYNIYDDNMYDYSAGLLGDATKEIANIREDKPNGPKGNWFTDYALFVTPFHPWFFRGGHQSDGAGAGIYCFSRYSDSENNLGTRRSVLAF